MVICGYLIDEGEENVLRQIGARDSKLLSDQRRRELSVLLKKAARDFMMITISASELDSMMEEKNLNRIEISKMQEIINLLRPDMVVIDCPETNTEKFCEKMRQGLSVRSLMLRCENHADRNHPVVSAASILAKVTRDDALEKIKKEVGFDFGTGYSHDERTVKFVREWYEKHHSFPDWVRKKWATSRNIAKEHARARGQKKMNDFFQ